MELCRAVELGPDAENILCEVHSSAEIVDEVTAAISLAVDAAEQASEPALMDCGVSSGRLLTTGAVGGGQGE